MQQPNTASQRHGMRRLVREGQVMILFAVASLVLIGAVAMAVDVGFLLAERRQVQAAADAAAMAAAQSGLDQKTSEIVSAGESYGAANAGSGATVVVDPNAPAPNGGDGERYVEVTITKDVQKFFLGAIYQGDWMVSASAIAAVEPVEANYALITLDKKASPGIYMNGNTGIVITGDEASAVSNSTIDGGNNTTFTVSGSIDAYGAISGYSGWDAPRGVRWDRKRYVEDPIVEAGVTPPTAPTTERDQSYVDNCLKSNPCTLSPGHYTDVNISINKAKLILSAGLFYFDGNSSINLKNDSELTGVGATLYFTGNSSIDPKNGSVDLRVTSAPDETVGQDDIVVWMARCGNLDLQGNGTMRYEGIFYAPCTQLTMHGNPNGETVNGQVIVGTLSVKGTSDLGIVYTKRAETFQPSVFLVQ